MKRRQSVAWRFFDRISDGSNRCTAVLCKLCNSQYKYFGNTTNLRVHLINKHPLQWELGQNGNFDIENFRVEDEDTNQSIPTKRRKYVRRPKENNVRYSLAIDNSSNHEYIGEESMPRIEIKRVDVLENCETDTENIYENEDDEATMNMVRQMHAEATDEEWLDEPFVKKMENKSRPYKVRNIKREVTSPLPTTRRSSIYTQSPRFEHIEPREVKDEFSVFGEYIANKLRKIKTPKTRGNIQQIITTILWQAEYGMYNEADSVRRLLSLSVTPQEEIQQSNLQDSQSIQVEEVNADNSENQSSESINLLAD